MVGLPVTLAQATELAVAALPVMLMPQVPLAPEPVLVGASVMPNPASVVGTLVSLAQGTSPTVSTPDRKYQSQVVLSRYTPLTVLLTISVAL